MKRTILCLALLSVVGLSQVLAATRLNQWSAISVGLTALKAKYPTEYRDLVLKYRPFVAKFEDGVWRVHGKTGIFVADGGAPEIDIRDRDSKILKVRFQP